jgi:hypothetical protein
MLRIGQDGGAELLTQPLGTGTEFGEQRRHMRAVDEQGGSHDPAVRVHPLFKSCQQFRVLSRW